MPAAFASLRAPAFRHVALAYTLGQVADWVVEVALALAVFDRTGSALASALVFVALRVVPVAGLPLAIGRSLRWLYTLRALAVLALAFGVDVLPVWSLLAIGLADGLGSLAGRAASRAAAARVLVDAERVRAGNALLNVAFSLAAALAPVGAGALVGGSGAGVALGAAAGLVAAAALVVFPLRLGHRRRGSAPVSVAGLRAVVFASGSGRLLGVEALLLVLFTAAVPVEVPFVKEALGAGDAGYGVLLTAWGAGMVAGSLAFAAVARVRLWVLAAGAALAVAAAYAVMGVAPSLAVAGVAAAVGGAGNGVQWVAFASWVQARAPLELAPKLSALLESMTALAPGVGFLAGGVAVSLVDPRTCLVASGVAIVVVVAAAALAGPSLSWGRSTGGRRAGARGALRSARHWNSGAAGG